MHGHCADALLLFVPEGLHLVLSAKKGAPSRR
jgi:hypothetical protein